LTPAVGGAEHLQDVRADLIALGIRIGRQRTRMSRELPNACT
jgi:hypothetical protein